MVPLAAAEPASGSAHWAIMSLEITLAVALFVAGLLIDRRASRRRRATGEPGVRAIAHPGAPITVALQVSGAHAAGPFGTSPLGTSPLGTSPLGTELVTAGAGEAGDQLCGGPGR
jgi:hypothetical protein